MGKIGIVLILIQLISKIFGFAREIVLSYFYGTSSISDAYLIAFTIPSILFTIIGTGITAGYIPTYNKIRKLECDNSAKIFTSNLINIIGVMCLFLAVITFMFPSLIVKLLASGFDAEKLELAIFFTRISVWSIIFLGISTIALSYLNINDSFYVSSLIGIPLNIGLIGGIILSYYHSKFYLAFGITIGYALQLIMITPVLQRKGYKHKLFLDLNDKYIKEIMLLAVPMIIGSCASQLNVVIDRTIASFLPTGSISALNYSSKLNTFIQGVLLTPIITILYPKISKLAANNEYNKLATYFYEVISLITLLVLPIMIGGMYLSRELTGILFLRGAFTNEALEITANSVFFYLLGIIGIAFREVQFRVYYSYGDTKTPVKNSIIAIGINIVLNLILSRTMGAPGLALSTSLSSIIASVLLQKDIKKYLRKLKTVKTILYNISKIFISNATMLLVLFIVAHFYPPKISILNLFIQILIGSSVYLVCLKFLNVKEFNKLINAIKQKNII